MNASKKVQYDVVVIGGGASGMMTAITAAQRGKKVILLEKNISLGQKLNITGGGRCNITNAEFNIRNFIKFYGRAEPFLYSPFSQFSAKDTFAFFEARGLPLVIQARNRVFPVTEKAVDVCNVFKKELTQLNVTIRKGCSVTNFLYNKENKHIQGVQTTTKEVITGDTYVLATGGMSHPETGSTGDGFTFLKQLGHTIKEPTPSLVPLQISDAWVHELSGVSLSFMKITFFVDHKKRFSKTGKILFTHFGVSGPLILNSSQQVSELLYEGLVTAEIDLFPDTNHGLLDDRLVKMFDGMKNKILKTVFKEILPVGTANSIETLFPEIDFLKKVHSVTKDERKHIVKILKALPMQIEGLMGYDRAVVADGGVILSEIDTKTMKSKIVDNLYVTGDLLHINRPSGGYGLQLCWTTGYVVGSNL